MIRRTIAAALLCAALTPATAATAQDQPQSQGSVGIRLAEAPENRKDDPNARIYIVDHLHQGATISRKVEVISTLTDPVDIRMYVGAAEVQDGAFVFGATGAENDLTDWSSVDPPTVHLDAGASRLATVTIAVPADAADGERYGVVWAELAGSGGQTNQINRVGVRIYLSVGEGEEPKSDFTIDELTASRDEEGRPVVATSVTNTGGRALNLSGELQLDDGPGSLSAGPFEMELGTTLAPADTDAARAVLDKDLPDGPWKATVTVRSGRLEKTATATITFPSSAGAVATPVKAKSTAKRTWAPIAVLLLLIVAIALLIVWLSRKREEARQQAAA